MRWFDKMFNSKDGLSWTKVWGTVVASAATIVLLPTMGIAVPVAVLTTAKIIGLLATKLTIDAARDGIDKNGLPPSETGKKQP